RGAATGRRRASGPRVPCHRSTMNPTIPREVSRRRSGLSAAPVAAALLVALAGSIGTARAQMPAVLSDGQDLTVTVAGNGLRSLAKGGDEWEFADVDPLVVRVTNLAGGRMTWSHYPGSQLLGTRPRVVPDTSTHCTVERKNCRLPGIVGKFDLIFEYELVPAPYGPGVAIHGRVENSSLPLGIAAVAYRQYLASSDEPDTVIGGFTGAIEVSF